MFFQSSRVSFWTSYQENAGTSDEVLHPVLVRGVDVEDAGGVEEDEGEVNAAAAL